MAVKVINKIGWVVIDDSILFIEDITTNAETYTSIFDNPVLKFYKKMHDSYGTVFLLPMFYSRGYNIATQTATGFNLAGATDAFKAEFQANSSWLKMSFHSYAGNVTYLSGSTIDTPDYAYSRDLTADWNAMKAQVIRFAGEECWLDSTIFHFGDCRKADVTALMPNKVIASFPYTATGRTVVGYLDKGQRDEFWGTGYYHDSSNGTLHCVRTVEPERINGIFKVSGTPKRSIEYLDYMNFRSKNFMNIGSHEVQIVNGINNIYSTKKDFQDIIAWCNMRGYTWKFPTKSDFNII